MSALWQSASGAHALELLVWIFARGSILVAAAWAASVIAGRRGAAVRHLAWAGSLAALLALPLLTRALPDAGLRAPVVPLEVWETGAGPAPLQPRVRPDGQGSLSPVAPEPSAADAGVGARRPGAPPPEDTRAAGLPWVGLVLGAWLAGALLFLARLAGRQVALRVVAGRARPWAGDAARRELRRLRAVLGVRRPVRLLEIDGLRAPACWGILRPVIGLPREAAGWSAARLRAVLVHELAHVRRWDYAVYVCGELAAALYWPNPAVWWAVGMARAEAEGACDETVLRHGTARLDYATLLLEAARDTRRSAFLPGPVMSLSPARDLRGRVRGVLDFAAPRPLSGLALAAAAVLGLAVALSAALPGLDSDAERRRTEALAAADAPAPIARADAARMLGRLRDHRSVPPLARLLGDDAPEVRAAAAAAIVEADPRLAVAPLMRRLEDPDGRVREAAILALGRTRDRRPFYDLEALTGSTDARIRLAATWAIGEIKCRPAILRLSAIAERSADADARLVAVRGLRGAPAVAATPALRRALRDPDARVRAAAAESLRLLS